MFVCVCVCVQLLITKEVKRTRGIRASLKEGVIEGREEKQGEAREWKYE